MAGDAMMGTGMMKRATALAFAAATALGAWALPAHAETRAVVVGVSGYPKLPEGVRLSGPKNDARAVANALRRFGVPAENISVLADGVSGLPQGVLDGGPGTRRKILEALDRLAVESGPGDLAVFFFSGHGSQQPDAQGDESGSNDEIFLPYDTGKWAGTSVEGAIVDDELSVRIERILDRGADFFGIIDACASATGFRDLPGEDVKVRGLLPEELGVPAGEAQSRGLEAAGEPRLDGVRQGGEGRGRATFFYAAQETEVALERPPKGGGESHGVFTFNLLRRLSENPGISYRRLHQAVVSDIKRGTLMATQTPELEGALLDEPALRLGGGEAGRQWPIFNGTLSAGALDGLSAGAVLALFDDPAAPDGAALTHGVVEEAGASKAQVAPIAKPCADGAPAAGCGALPDEATWKKGRWARLVEPGVDFSLTLSEPVRIDPEDGFDYGPALAALEAALHADGVKGRVSTRAQGFDLAVALVDGKLAFAPAAGLLDRAGPGSSPRLSLPAEPQAAAAAVESALNRMARALALQRLGDAASGAELGLGAQVLARRVKEGADLSAGCPAEDDAYGPPEAADEATVFGDCDILSVAMTNKGRKPIDVTVLLIGQDFSIQPVWPVEGAANRIQTGETRTADILQMEPDPASGAEERLVFIAVPGVNRSHVAFDSFEQEGLRAAPGDAAEIAAAKALLASALTDSGTRAAAVPKGVDEQIAVEVAPFRVAPAKGS